METLSAFTQPSSMITYLLGALLTTIANSMLQEQIHFSHMLAFGQSVKIRSCLSINDSEVILGWNICRRQGNPAWIFGGTMHA